jgi:hypothetical protein
VIKSINEKVSAKQLLCNQVLATEEEREPNELKRLSNIEVYASIADGLKGTNGEELKSLSDFERERDENQRSKQFFANKELFYDYCIMKLSTQDTIDAYTKVKDKANTFKQTSVDDESENPFRAVLHTLRSPSPSANGSSSARTTGERPLLILSSNKRPRTDGFNLSNDIFL